MLSEPGAPAAEGTVPLSVPALRGNEWKYVKECLDSNWVSSAGPFVERFERMVAGFVGAKHAVSTQSGTAALHIALLVAGIQPEDEVLVSTLTFIAPANTIRYCGAWPVLIDAEPAYWQMDPHRVVDFLERECQWASGELRNRTTGRRVKAVLPVHILGHPVDMDPILEVARKYRLAVVEDATESLGAKYRDKLVGRLGDIACFSFNGNKIITTGGGGMIVTDCDEWARKARHLATQAKQDPIEYVHDEIGYNYRLTNVQAALGCAQMENLCLFVEAKRTIAASYARELAGLPGLTLMREAPGVFSTFWMFTILAGEACGRDRRALFRYLNDKGIQTRPLWQPLHRSPVHRHAQACESGVADRLCHDALSLPCSVGLSRSELARVVQALCECLKGGNPCKS